MLADKFIVHLSSVLGMCSKWSCIIFVTDASIGDKVALLIEHRTCDLQVVGWSPGWPSLCSGLGNLLTPVFLCHQAV